MANDSEDGRIWLAAPEALALIALLYTHPNLAKAALIDQAAAGLLASRCRRFIYQPPDGAEPETHDHYDMPLGFWQQFDQTYRRRLEDWSIGNFDLSQVDDDSVTLARAHGVKFLDDDLRTLPGVPSRSAAPAPANVGATRYTDLWPGDDPTVMRALERRIAELEAEIAAKATSSPNPPHAGGRPPKPFWDGMWADMVRQMYTGDLKYSRLSEIEAAMHEWLIANGHEAGETAIRERARRLFAALQKEVGN